MFRRPPSDARPVMPPERDDGDASPYRPSLSKLRAARRVSLFLLFTFFCCSTQFLLINLPGNAKRAFPRFYWRGVCLIMGIKPRLVGRRSDTKKPVIYVANHASWSDIPLLGACFKACFISKSEVGRWPGISIVARLGRTVFVSRGRGKVADERDTMKARLTSGDDLILFPEGTSSDSARVLPFRSAFFSLVEQEEPPVLQPVSIAYDRMDGLPILRSNRAHIGWYGAMDLVPHLLHIAAHQSISASVRLHPPLDTTEKSRKKLTQDAWDIIATHAAAQRRHEPPVSLPPLDHPAPV